MTGRADSCLTQNREKARSKKDFFGSGGFGGEV